MSLRATPPPAPIPWTSARRRRIETSVALLIAIALALAWTIPLSTAHSWGWDESMNAELPAARMLVAAQLGRTREALGALLDCSRYPFVYPLVLALVQGAFGISDHVCRVLGTVTWCTALFGLFLLGRELARALQAANPGRSRSWALLPWATMALGALSPLALSYAGTIFLEVPFACAAVFTLRAWLRRRGDLDAGTRARRELAAGAWIAVMFFTKFNYGLMLGAGLTLDWIAESVGAARRRELRAHLRASLWLATLPVIAGLWWFVLPLPAGLDMGQVHREEFIGFLTGNRFTGLAATPFGYKVLNSSGYFAFNPRLMLLQVISILASLRFVSVPAVRGLWFVLVAMWLSVWLHPFHLDRFLVPGGAPFWPLAACGALSLMPASVPARLAALASAIVLVLIPIDDTLWVADKVGVAQQDPALRAYQAGIFASWHDLSGSRGFKTNGLSRAESDRFLDAIAQTLKPDESVAWFGLSTELSPSALHLGLLERGESRERFLRETARPIDVAYFHHDPGWTDAELLSFARGFDVVLFTEPIDFKARPTRQFMRDYCRRLTDVLGYRKTKVAEISIALPMGQQRKLELFACRAP
jgi:hypothetical protein